MGWFGVKASRSGNGRARGEGGRVPVEEVEAVYVERPGPVSRLPQVLPRRRDCETRRPWG
jgi:hypothetical protein